MTRDDILAEVLQRKYEPTCACNPTLGEICMQHEADFDFALSLVTKALEGAAKDTCHLCFKSLPLVDKNESGWYSHQEEGKGYPRKCEAMYINQSLRELRDGLEE